MTMPFSLSSEAKNAYFMSDETINELFIFALRDEINGIFMTKIRIFLLLYTILSRTDFCIK